MALPAVGAPVALHTDLLVREDLLQLFGFQSRAEREWHRMLMSVQGVGAKASLAILGALGAEGVGRAIALGDQSAIRAAKGIGPKTALRVVNELKDKAPNVMAMAADEAGGGAFTGATPDGVIDLAPASTGATAPPAPGSSGAAQGAARGAARGAAQGAALSALTNLGYAPSDAAAAVAQAAEATHDADEAALIRAALQLLAPKGT